MKEKETTKQAKLIHLDTDTINKIAHKAVDAGKSVKKYMEDAIKEIAAK